MYRIQLPLLTLSCISMRMLATELVRASDVRSASNTIFDHGGGQSAGISNGIESNAMSSVLE